MTAFTDRELEQIDAEFASRLRHADFVARNCRAEKAEPNLHPIFAGLIDGFKRAPQTIADAQAAEFSEGATK